MFEDHPNCQWELLHVISIVSSLNMQGTGDSAFQHDILLQTC